MKKSKDYKIDWKSRLVPAEIYFSKWKKNFKVDQSVEYFEGFQWEGYKHQLADYSPYTVNLVYSTLKVKRASLLFDNPTFIIKPAPQTDALDFDPASSAERATLKTIALNNWVNDKRNYFLRETKMAMVDAFFAFGLVEVDYSANFIANPNANKPSYEEDENNSSDNYKKSSEPEEIPESEQVFIKRIHFNQFRIGGRDAYILERSNWCGYYEYYDVRDVKEAWPRAYKDLKYTGSRTSEGSADILASMDETDSEYKELFKSGDVVKIWKFWDFRAKQIFWWDETHDLDLESVEFDSCSLHALIFDERRRGFLPIPPCFNWLSPQNEINEASEQLRVHRRRSSNKYFINEQIFDDEDEFQKALFGPDGTFVKTKQTVSQGDIGVFPQNPISGSVTEAFLQSKDNFNVVTLSGSEMRGNVDRETATAANIKAQATQQADSEPKVQVAQWLNDIARSIILNLARTTIPFWIKHSSTQQNQPIGAQIQPNQPQFSQISGEDLEGEDFETVIKISSISPLDNESEFNKLLKFLSVVNQFQEIALSPTLIREVAEKLGYNNEHVIAELQKMAQLRMVQMMEAQQQEQIAQQSKQSGGNQAAQNQVANASPPQQEQINQQVSPANVLN